MNEVVGKTTLYGKRPGEAPFEITVEIGMPYKVGDDPESWACPVSIVPLHKRLADQHGVDSLQALGLTMRLVRLVLEGFREDGGALSHDGTTDDFQLQNYGL